MNDKNIVAVLHNIRSRENVGSMFRTADAAGVSKLYLCGITPTPPHDKIAKTALGAEHTVAWEYHKQTWRLLRHLKREGHQVLALEKTKASRNIFAMKARFPVVFVVGNEVRGLSPQLLNQCDEKVAIPMHGRKESLNVGVAFGIAAYALRRLVR